MSISVAVPVNKSARVRALKANHPYMTPEDIAATTGMRLALVNAALSKGELLKKPKSRLVGTGSPLAAEPAVARPHRVASARRIAG